MTTMTAQRAASPPRAPEVPHSPPIPVSGILDAGDSGAYLRIAGYQRDRDDVQLPAAMIRQYGLRSGDHLEGTASPSGAGRPARQGSARQNQARPQHVTLTSLDTVNGRDPRTATDRPDFAALTPLYPDERLRLESAGGSPIGRIIDLVSPIGKGQRGLIVSPPKAGKTMVLQAIAAAIAANHPEVHLMVVLVGERPEEVTDLRRSSARRGHLRHLRPARGRARSSRRTGHRARQAPR